MPSVRYMNNSAPFWDWVASLEQDGAQHPWFSQWNQTQNNANENERSEERPGRPPFGPWGWDFPFGGGRGMPHRGPPPHHHDEHDEKEKNGNENHDGEKDNDKEMKDDNGEGPSGSGSETEGRHRGRGHCGSRRGRHGCGGPRGFGGPGSHHGPGRHGPHHRGRGGFGPWGRGGFGPGFNPWAFASSFLDPKAEDKNENNDFTPEADIFDTPTSFVIHVSLPGAKKEDVGVNWDIEKSELSIAGVIYRPGDEDFLKTLAMDERKVGPFERKVRLGTRANPAQIDADGITAKLEDGVLRVEVPKLGDNGFVEVRKVDIE
ncbi:hypothetical protein GRF29_69g1306263 [Pseudopithomyces chartarum]|uniref:SHSP domain-containing protein n=1 Tax=Pseudopithomyces chartarum TaxID=1892770 RepID=A0AAN6RJ95_9PLEO|nr:hypothetical protein GRF29_69g1306263 [Pseudopithomyces chartarum]